MYRISFSAPQNNVTLFLDSNCKNSWAGADPVDHLLPSPGLHSRQEEFYRTTLKWIYIVWVRISGPYNYNESYSKPQAWNPKPEILLLPVMCQSKFSSALVFVHQSSVISINWWFSGLTIISLEWELSESGMEVDKIWEENQSLYGSDLYFFKPWISIDGLCQFIRSISTLFFFNEID